MTHLVIPSCSGVLDAFNTRLSRYYRKESFCCLQGDVDTLLALAVFSYIYIFPACCSSSCLWEFKISDFKRYLGYVGGSKSKDLQTALLSLQKAQYMWEYKTFDKAINIKSNGEMLTPDSEKFLGRISRQELPIPFKYHNLRHTHASWLAEHEVPSIVTKKRLGHSKEETTLRYYTHITQGMRDNLMALLNGQKC